MAFVDPKIAATVAHLEGVHVAVLAERDKLAEVAAGLFAPHNHPGRHELFTDGGKTDASFGLQGPTFASVMSMEFGHWTRGHKKYVEGLHILGRTIAQARG